MFVEPSGHSPGHAFISYVREDSDNADWLQWTMESAGIRVWRDTADLWPGEDWRAKIRQAITADALFFVACFSRNSLARDVSYQNEELVLAIEQLRLRHPDQPWLIPVRFDDCAIPDLDIGGGRTLGSIQRADLYGDRREAQAARLVEIVARKLGLRLVGSDEHELPPFVTTLSRKQSAALPEEPRPDHLPAAWNGPPRVKILPASDQVARQLQIPPGEPVVSRHQRRWIDGTPWSMQTSYYSMELVNRGAAELLQTTEVKGGTASYLEQVLGLREASRRDEIEARMPNPDEAAFFQLSGDGRVPVLAVTRIALDGDGSPIRMTVSSFPADRNRVNYEEDQP
jgi:TIR domain/UTRA domain